MAIVFEEALKKNISAGKLSPVYILFGDDGYLKKLYADKILKLITEPDDVFNCCRFDGECDLQEVYDAAMQLPFAAEKKYIEICDFDFEHCSKTELDRFYRLISDVPDSAVLVLKFESTEFDAKKSSKFKKAVTATEKNGGIAARLDHRKQPELAKMLTDGAAKRGCKMDSAAARYLVETAGDDINLLINELNKLCFYVKNGDITRDTVDKVSVKTVEASVYNLSRHILDCDAAASLKVLNELFYMRIEPMIILYTVSSVYVDMMRIYAARKQGLSIKDVADKFGYKGREFVLEKAAGNLRRFDGKKLNLSEPQIVLQQLAIKLIYIIARGESVDKIG